MVGIQIEKIIAGIVLFTVAYILLFIQGPLFTEILRITETLGIDTGFILQMQWLGGWFCIFIGVIAIIYIILAGFTEEANIIEGPRYPSY